MATKTNEAERSTVEAALEALQLDVEATLPPASVLEVAGVALGRADILGILQAYREVHAAHEKMVRTHDRAEALWPQTATETELCLRAVERALDQCDQSEVGDGSHATAARRALAAAKRDPTCEIRGVHLRPRVSRVRGGRYPWEE